MLAVKSSHPKSIRESLRHNTAARQQWRVEYSADSNRFDQIDHSLYPNFRLKAIVNVAKETPTTNRLEHQLEFSNFQLPVTDSLFGLQNTFLKLKTHKYQENRLHYVTITHISTGRDAELKITLVVAVCKWPCPPPERQV